MKPLYYQINFIAGPVLPGSIQGRACVKCFKCNKLLGNGWGGPYACHECLISLGVIKEDVSENSGSKDSSEETA